MYTTHMACGMMKSCRVTDWVEGQRDKKWGMAGHTARRKDGRWTLEAMLWDPPGVDKRKAKWEDDIKRFIKHKYPRDHSDWK